MTCERPEWNSRTEEVRRLAVRGKPLPALYALVRWRLTAYARVTAHALARHAKTLALAVGIFVFGLPLNAQLDLLGMPVTVLLEPQTSGLSDASTLTMLSMLAAATVSVQHDAVFGGAARRWILSLPGGSYAHRVADFVMTAIALWPFWIMLAATIARHAVEKHGGPTRPGLAPVVATVALVWMGAPLALLSRSRAALGAIIAANGFLWMTLRNGGAWAAWTIPALACGAVALWRARLDLLTERERRSMTVLRGAGAFAFVWALLQNVNGHSLRLGGLLLFALGAIGGWLSSLPDYQPRHWGIANVILPFALYQIAVLHGWMRDEAGRMPDWLGSLPGAIARFKWAAATSVVGLSSTFVLALCIVFVFETGELRRYTGAFACYTGVAILLAACRWWGPSRSRIVDIALTIGGAVVCYGILK